MRRSVLSMIFVALTGTLLGQTPQSMPLTQPDRFNCKVSFSSRQMDGSKLILKDARLEFALGVTITADEAMFDTTSDGVVIFSGNVQMTLKKN